MIRKQYVLKILFLHILMIGTIDAVQWVSVVELGGGFVSCCYDAYASYKKYLEAREEDTLDGEVGGESIVVALDANKAEDPSIYLYAAKKSFVEFMVYYKDRLKRKITLFHAGMFLIVCGGCTVTDTHEVKGASSGESHERCNQEKMDLERKKNDFQSQLNDKVREVAVLQEERDRLAAQKAREVEQLQGVGGAPISIPSSLSSLAPPPPPPPGGRAPNLSMPASRTLKKANQPVSNSNVSKPPAPKPAVGPSQSMIEQLREAMSRPRMNVEPRVSQGSKPGESVVLQRNTLGNRSAIEPKLFSKEQLLSKLKSLKEASWSLLFPTVDALKQDAEVMNALTSTQKSAYDAWKKSQDKKTLQDVIKVRRAAHEEGEKKKDEDDWD